MKPEYFLKENHISYMEITLVLCPAFQVGCIIPEKNVTAFMKTNNIIGSVRKDE